MARLVRPLWQFPLLHRHRFCPRAGVPPSPSPLIETTWQLPRFHRSNSYYRGSRGGGGVNALSPLGTERGESSGSDSGEFEFRRSRNQRKREARRGVKWGMELACFTPPQIRRIVKIASLEREVLEALMLVKRFGPDVKEGKRRQYNYIGKLLRDVEPALMEALILATRDGDWSRLQVFSGLEMGNDANVEEDIEETDNDDEEGSEVYIDMATRWFDGLVNKDIEVTKEVYAIRNVDFDRQKLRKLVRTVHEVQQINVTEEKKKQVDASILTARKSLTRFLRVLARQISTEPSFVDV